MNFHGHVGLMLEVLYSMAGVWVGQGHVIYVTKLHQKVGSDQLVPCVRWRLWWDSIGITSSILVSM